MTDTLQAVCFYFTNQSQLTVVNVKTRTEWEMRNNFSELTATGNTVDYYRRTAANSVNNMV